MTCTCEACLWESERADEAWERVAEADPGPERDERWWELVLAWEPYTDEEVEDGEAEL